MSENSGVRLAPGFSTTGIGRWATVELLGDKLLSFRVSSCQFGFCFSECVRICPTVY